MIARNTVIIRAILFILLLPLVFSFADVFAGGTESHPDLGSELPLWSAIPFGWGRCLSQWACCRSHRIR